MVGVLVVKDDLVVQSLGFERYLPVGVPSIAVDYLNRWGIDEIVLLDIHASLEGRGPRFEKIAEYAKHAQVPFAVGGGIAETHDIDRIIRSGADKVVLNTAVASHPSLIADGARRYGNQCIVVSIDARQHADGRYEVYTNAGRRPTGMTPAEWARVAEEHGAGEILLNSIDRDGSKRGYDAALIEPVVQAVRIPVIVCGGVGHPGQFLEAIRLGASAVAAANFFHYTEHSVAVAKRALSDAGADVRLDMLVGYEGACLVRNERLAKRPDDVLEKLRFEHIPEEVI